MKIKKRLLALISMLLLTACAGVPLKGAHIQQDMGKSSGHHVASLIKKTNDIRLNRQIEGATPFLVEFLPRIACVRDPNTEVMNLLPRYMTSDSFRNRFVHPLFAMRYHDKRRCLSIERISDWKSLAKNAVSVSVLFSADDSGESSLTSFTLIEQPDGSWLGQF